MLKKYMGCIIIFVLVVQTAGLWAQNENPVATKDLNIFSWRHIGPWTFSGRITDLAVPPGQSRVYYVATATGGLWKTEDNGKVILSEERETTTVFTSNPSSTNTAT